MAVNANDFLLNTDYEMDKIVYMLEGTIMIDGDATILGDGSRRETKYFPTGLPFQPLIFGFCSYNEDFSDAKTIPFSSDLWFPGGGTPVRIEGKISFSAQMEDGTLVLTYTVAQSIQDPRPIHYRIYGFEPTTSNTKIGKTSGKAKMFVLDTDHNYRKIMKKGVVMPGENFILNHRLGYIPQIMAWAQFDWPFEPHQKLLFMIDEQVDGVIKATKNTITISFPSSYWELLHYRIYYDEA